MNAWCQTCQHYASPKKWKRRNKDTGFCNHNQNYGLVHKAHVCGWWTKREKKS